MGTERSFADLRLPQRVTDSIQRMGFEKPTPVQAESIPLLLEGRDLVSLAETGSGKTAAYLIPTVAAAMKNPRTLTLVLVPTRELAAQILDVLRKLTDFRATVLIGGSSMYRQVRDLKNKPRFLIATPGRLMDHVRQRTLDLSKVTTLVLDEADRMFDMGFAPQVKEIVELLPSERQTVLFSATFPKEVRKLADRILKNPAEVEVRKATTPAIITQRIVETEQNRKNDTTLDLINAATGSVLIFARTKSRTDRLARYLSEYGVCVTRIHGDRTQGQRNKSINDFKNGVMKVLVATDIAARGLDVPQVSDVINYDLPMTSEDYVHRIGRTGRAGQAGQAITLVTPEERKRCQALMSGTAPRNFGGFKRPSGGQPGFRPGRRPKKKFFGQRQGGNGRRQGGNGQRRRNSESMSHR